MVRPLVVGLRLLPPRLRPFERNFVLFAGLKGAVPILVLAARVPHAAWLYGIVVVVLVFSVAVQSGLVPAVAHRLRLPMRTVEPESWTLRVRLREESEGVQRVTIEPGSAADGSRIADLTELPQDDWIRLAVRDNQLLAIHGDTQLRPGDELAVLADVELRDEVLVPFTAPAADAGSTRPHHRRNLRRTTVPVDTS